VKLLLATHAALWWLADDDQIGEEVIREVAIKRSLGKLDAPEDLPPTLLGAGAQPLPVTLELSEYGVTIVW
jgi:PIN domain nuclease of toxin-antitoxin system